MTDDKAVMQPVAWMTKDGRVASDATKINSMASPSKEAFNIPLYLSCAIAQPEQKPEPEFFRGNWPMPDAPMMQLKQPDDSLPQLPVPVAAIEDGFRSSCSVFTSEQMREYVFADRMQRQIAQPEQPATPVAHAEPVATVIEELDHDGQGWCSKVRWLYNPVPLGEILFWEQSK